MATDITMSGSDHEDWLVDYSETKTLNTQENNVDSNAWSSEREYERMSNHYSKAGYREGMVDGRASTMQEGFDQGFNSENGARLGARVGIARGIASGLLTMATSSTTLASSASTSATSGSASTSNLPKRTSLLQLSPENVTKLREIVRDLGKIKLIHFDDPDFEQQKQKHEQEQQENDEQDTIQKEISMDQLEDLMDKSNVGSRQSKQIQPSRQLFDSCIHRLDTFLKSHNIDSQILYQQ